MPVKTVVSGKHPVIVRIKPEDYKTLLVEAAWKGVTVNEMISAWVEENARTIRGKEEP